MHAASARHTNCAGWSLLNYVDPDTMVRLRVVVAAGKPAPPDLAHNALVALEAFADREDRLCERNEHIRRAAVLIDGSPWARACTLAKEAKVIERIWHRLGPTQPEVMTLRGELHAAKLWYRLPGTVRSFSYIISH